MTTSRKAVALLATWLLLLMAMSVRAVIDPPVASAAGPSAWRCSSADLGLGQVRVELAPVNPSERTPQGGRIIPSAGTRGRWVPVIFVHGWTARATHPNTEGSDATRGTFSHPIDLTANRLGTAAVPRSLVGQIQGLEGAAVFTFDYHPYSGRWVDDPHLGPALGKVIDCLYSASGEEVIIVGHSMGGLVARYAAAGSDGVGSRASKISSVITLGTPTEGSVAAMLAANVVDAAIDTLPEQTALLRLFLSACAHNTTASMDTGTVCDAMPAVSAFYGEAGRALRYGSDEIKALQPVPRGIVLHALAGGAQFNVPRLGWFSLPWQTEKVNLGDVVVTSGSALASAASNKSVSCEYQLNAFRGATDWLGLRLRLTSKAEAAATPLGVASGPCFHTSLMRSIELTNEVMGLIADDLDTRGATSGPGDLTDEQVLDSQLPANVCWTGKVGFDHASPIQLKRGKGTAWNKDGSFGGASILETEVLGRVDLNGDGKKEIILSLDCAGSPPEDCCAGRSSLVTTLAVLAPSTSHSLDKVAPSLMGGASAPGNEYGPADRKIGSATLRGRAIVTTEYITYPEQYTPDQVGGDPYQPVEVEYKLERGTWIASRP